MQIFSVAIHCFKIILTTCRLITFSIAFFNSYESAVERLFLYSLYSSHFFPLKRSQLFQWKCRPLCRASYSVFSLIAHPAFWPARVKNFSLILFLSHSIFSSFQMAPESNHTIVIAALGDWLKNLTPVFPPMRSKTKFNCTLYTLFLPRSQEVTGNCQQFWLVHRAMSLVVIGRSNSFLIGFSESRLKTSPLKLFVLFSDYYWTSELLAGWTTKGWRNVSQS